MYPNLPKPQENINIKSIYDITVIQTVQSSRIKFINHNRARIE